MAKQKEISKQLKARELIQSNFSNEEVMHLHNAGVKLGDDDISIFSRCIAILSTNEILILEH